MSVKKTTAALQEALLLEHEDLFWILCHALGGVILQTQFLKWLSKTAHGTSTAMRLKNLLVEVGLVKSQRIIKNNILVPTSAVLRKRTSIHRVNVGTRKIFYSAYVMSLLIEKGLHRPAEARKFLENTTLPHYFVPAGYSILCALERYEKQIAAQ